MQVRDIQIINGISYDSFGCGELFFDFLMISNVVQEGNVVFAIDSVDITNFWDDSSS